MRKNDLARRLAKAARVSPAEAADYLDRVLHEIVQKVRHGKRAELPGLGTFTPGARPAFEFLDELKKSSRKDRNN